MGKTIADICDRIIEYSLYGVFLITPFLLSNETFELFEFNKMWFVFGITVVVAASWITKMIIQKQFFLSRTPLDIPIALFLLAHIISSIFSLDSHVSLWGYYSRFNGGLLSMLSYALLYYAFLSNFPDRLLLFTKRFLALSITAGVGVALWGLPSHFGYDPTCLLFRGSFDVSCWTEAFQPKVRIFSTLGQPAWLAAYLAILLPIVTSYALKKSKHEYRSTKQYQNINDKKSNSFGLSNFRISNFEFLIYLSIAILFYLDLIYANTRGGFLGYWVSHLVFWTLLFLPQTAGRKRLILVGLSVIDALLMAYFLATAQYVILWFATILGFLAVLAFFARAWLFHYALITITFLVITVLQGTAFAEINSVFTAEGLKAKLTTTKQVEQKPQVKDAVPALEGGGTESASIRRIVWKGALDAWLAYPVFGTGVETFAFAYYKYRPTQHNLTSEWDYLYNKAHNEYLNYLTTTGAFGLFAHMLMIFVFLFVGIRWIIRTQIDSGSETSSLSSLKSPLSNLLSQISSLKSRIRSRFPFLNSHFSSLNSDPQPSHTILIIGLIASFVGMLVTNFFGFSVVITNLYLFFIPAFVFILQGHIHTDALLVFPKPEALQKPLTIAVGQWLSLICVWIISSYWLIMLVVFWFADKSYAIGYNLDRVGQYADGYTKLKEAVSLRSDEPVFLDELSVSAATLAVAYAQAQNATQAATLAQEAVDASNRVVAENPNNVVFWKTRVRAFYTLSTANPQYLPFALEAIKRASELAPTDAKIAYNLGVIYGQNGDSTKAVEVLENAIQLKPDYRDAHYALGLFYHDLAVDKNGVVIKPELQEKAVAQMRYILDKIGKDDKQVLEALQSWKI